MVQSKSQRKFLKYSKQMTRNVHKKIKYKIRRGGKNLNKKHKKSFTIIGSNAAGLLSKKESLIHNINLFNPAAVLLQETKQGEKIK